MSASASSDPGADGSNVPSDWQVATVGPAQLQIPPDWTLESIADQQQTMRAPKDSIGLSPGFGNILADPNAGGGEGEGAVDEWAKLTENALIDDVQNLKRLPNVTINGEVFYHFQGEGEGFWQDHYGTVVPGGEDRVTITWRFNQADIDRKGADALIAQIMPTYKVL
ncbi:hypothetical protein ACFVJS_08380 [Nocardioides sp. NPDC057772]|uniref:hypothetical protein n=1 Tax=Nocardioides sp. NPDC057772 TaxID=3346245 RepID=UPI003670ABF2